VPSLLFKELRQKYNVLSTLIWKDGEVQLCKDTTKVSRLAKESRFTGRDKSSTLNWYSRKELMGQLSHGAFTSARRLSPGKTGQRLQKDPRTEIWISPSNKGKGKLQRRNTWEDAEIK
jgi:hypothetical protein